MTAPVQQAFHDGVVTLSLNRPDKFNALGPVLFEALLDAIRTSAAQAQTRAIVLTGNGAAFSAGGDMAWFAKVLAGGSACAAEAIDRVMEEVCNPTTLAIAECAVPVIAAVNGPCVGGAVGLVLACDVVLAARSAYFLVPQTPQLGLVPDLGATWALSRQLGRGRALGAVLLGERIAAERAEQWGLIWRCVDDADLLSEAGALAQRMAGLSGAALQGARQLIDAGHDQSLPQQLDAERRVQRQLAATEFFNQACARFARRATPT